MSFRDGNVMPVWSVRICCFAGSDSAFSRVHPLWSLDRTVSLVWCQCLVMAKKVREDLPEMVFDRLCRTGDFFVCLSGAFAVIIRGCRDTQLVAEFFDRLASSVRLDDMRVML